MFSNELLYQEYEYDFAVDGGATGDIDLAAKAGKAPLPVGAVVMEVYAEVVTAVTSAGSLTMSWGDGTGNDVDGYSGTAIAVASLTLNTVFDGKADSGALLPSKVLTAATGAFSVSIAVAAATAGKIKFRVVYAV